MQRTQDELYTLVKDLKTKAQFTKEITKRYKTYGELLDKDTIAFLLADELGRNTFSLTSIAGLTADKDATVVATVQGISEVKTFRKKNGTVGKVLNLEISDASGRCRLVLWNEDIELVKSRDITIGTCIRIINGYTKTSYTGLELNLGKWGMLDVEPPETHAPSHQIPPPIRLLVSCRAARPPRRFFKDNGDFGFVTTIIIKTPDGGTQPVTLWDASVKAIQDIKLGETIVLHHVEKKTMNGTDQWHLNGAGSIEKTRPPTRQKPGTTTTGEDPCGQAITRHAINATSTPRRNTAAPIARS